MGCSKQTEMPSSETRIDQELLSSSHQNARLNESRFESHGAMTVFKIWAQSFGINSSSYCSVLIGISSVLTELLRDCIERCVTQNDRRIEPHLCTSPSPLRSEAEYFKSPWMK